MDYYKQLLLNAPSPFVYPFQLLIYALLFQVLLTIFPFIKKLLNVLCFPFWWVKSSVEAQDKRLKNEKPKSEGTSQSFWSSPSQRFILFIIVFSTLTQYALWTGLIDNPIMVLTHFYLFLGIFGVMMPLPLQLTMITTKNLISNLSIHPILIYNSLIVLTISTIIISWGTNDFSLGLIIGFIFFLLYIIVLVVISFFLARRRSNLTKLQVVPINGTNLKVIYFKENY